MAKKTQNSGPSALDKPIRTSGLTRKERRYVIEGEFKKYGPSLTYPEKIKSLAARLGMAQNAVLLMGKRWGWDVLEIEAQHDPSPVTVVAPESDLDKPFSTAEFVNELKVFTRRAIEVSSRFSAVTARIIELYATRIECKIASTPDPGQYDLAELEFLYSNLSFYMNKAAKFTSPGGVASLLNAIRFGDSIPPPAEGIEAGVTIHRLQQTLLEMGALQQPTPADSFATYASIFPDISGTRVE